MIITAVFSHDLLHDVSFSHFLSLHVHLVPMLPRCAKVPGFESKLLFVLLPMMVRMGEDFSEWEAAEPEDGLNDGDEEDDEEKEVGYATEAMDRLCEAVGGDKLSALLLTQLQTMIGGEEVPWQKRHAALVAVAQVSGHAPSVIEPHLASLIQLLGPCATAANPRLRWATFYCMGLLCTEFSSMAESHAVLVPLVVAGMSDGCMRVQVCALVTAIQQAAQPASPVCVWKGGAVRHQPASPVVVVGGGACTLLMSYAPLVTGRVTPQRG